MKKVFPFALVLIVIVNSGCSSYQERRVGKTPRYAETVLCEDPGDSEDCHRSVRSRRYSPEAEFFGHLMLHVVIEGVVHLMFHHHH